MANKLTVTYGGTTIIDEAEISGDAAVTYGGSTIATVSAGGTKTLNCNGKYMTTNVGVATKTLNCANQIMSGDVTVSVASSSVFEAIRAAVAGGARDELVGTIVPDTWTKSGTSYDDPWVVVSVEQIQDENDVTHWAAILQRQYATVDKSVFISSGNRYLNSTIRTYLTSTASGNYQSGCSADLLAAVKPIKVTCAVKGSSSLDTMYDKFFLPSLTQMYGTNSSLDGKEGTYWKYWKDKTGLSSPSNSSNDGRKITQVTSKTGSAVYWWLRSPSMSDSPNAWHVGTDGWLSNHKLASNSYCCTPACAIY